MIIKPRTHQWYSKTIKGWFIIHNVEFSPEEKQIFQSEGESPEKQNLINQFNKLAVQETNPPEIVITAFNNHYNNHELITANINDKGHGIIYTKKNNNYDRISF